MEFIIFIIVLVALIFWVDYSKLHKLKSALIKELQDIVLISPNITVNLNLFDGYKDPVDIFHLACEEAIRLEACLAFEEHSDALIDDYHSVENSSKYGIFDGKKWQKTISPLVDHYSDDYHSHIYGVFNTMADLNKFYITKVDGYLDATLKNSKMKFSEQLLNITSKSLM